LTVKNQQPSEQPPDEKFLPEPGGIIAYKSFIMWCPEGDLNPHSLAACGFYVDDEHCKPMK
jgi:hypothetical protein